MSAYRDYPPAGPLLIGYDPDRDLHREHLARLVDRLVDEAVNVSERTAGAGQPALHPRLLIKVLVYAYSIGVRSSRQIERLCQESLPFLLLTRGTAPSHTALCQARLKNQDALEAVFASLFVLAEQMGIVRIGRIVLDSTKFRANASPEAVLPKDQYAAVRAELSRILTEAAETDAREDAEGAATDTVLPRSVCAQEMRDIVRRVRRQQAERNRSQSLPADAQKPSVSPVGESEARPVVRPRMRKRIEQAIAAIDAAVSEERKHLCLTDPDARMLGEGRSKQIKECHSFEVAVDNGLLVATGVTTDPDNSRLLPLVAAAQEREANGIVRVDADSGYYSGSAVALLEQQGIATCIPDTNTACDLRRGMPLGTTAAKSRGTVSFTYDREQDCYHCPEANRLVFIQQRPHSGQQMRVYRAEKACRSCPQAGDCLTQATAKYRRLNVGVEQAVLSSVRKRFEDAEHIARYHQRGPDVETVFGFVRGTLGFTSWLLRGTARVLCESRLFAVAYQFRKVHARLMGAPPGVRRAVAPV